MAYQSKLEYIQRKLAEEGSQHGFVDDIDFGKKWKEILSASQIMNPQESGNVQTFEAERTVWNFYCEFILPIQMPKLNSYRE
jgi:hypothetical protein